MYLNKIQAILKIVGSEIKTYKGLSDNVCSGTMNYTIYPICKGLFPWHFFQLYWVFIRIALHLYAAVSLALTLFCQVADVAVRAIRNGKIPVPEVTRKYRPYPQYPRRLYHGSFIMNIPVKMEEMVALPLNTTTITIL